MAAQFYDMYQDGAAPTADSSHPLPATTQGYVQLGEAPAPGGVTQGLEPATPTTSTSGATMLDNSGV